MGGPSGHNSRYWAFSRNVQPKIGSIKWNLSVKKTLLNVEKIYRMQFFFKNTNLLSPLKNY